MMQSQGLGALMPQDAQQMAPQQQMPPMDPQRLAAATNLVSSDAERQVLDPRTLALIKYKDAVAAMQAADELMAASQPTPTPPTVAERVQQSAQEGIMGLASRLGAGIQQQGSNMQAEQLQQAMSGGLPQLPAPNMAGMAQGGIVGFDVGGEVLTPEMIAAAQEALANAPETIRNPVISPQQRREALVRAERDAAFERGQRDTYTNQIIRMVAMGVPRDVARRIIDEQNQLSAEQTFVGPRESTLEPATEAVPQAPAPTAEETIAPFNLSSLDRFNLPTESTAPTAPTMPAAQAETAPAAAQPSRGTAGLEAMLEQIQGQTFDPEAAADARSEELRRLTGADDLMSQRAEAERRRRELAESRFSPEERRRRALQAGLAGLAQRGLGGFSAGATAEEERIYAEQMGESERSVAEMDRMIADLRARGMTEFEARNTARALMQQQQDTQTQRQVEVLSALTQDDRQRAQIAMQETVARIQAESGQFAQSINILTRAGRTEEEALQEIAAMTQRAQADPADARWQQAVNRAYEQVGADPMMMGKPLAEITARATELAGGIYETMSNMPRPAGGQPEYARNPDTGERIVSMDGGATWQPVQ